MSFWQTFFPSPKTAKDKVLRGILSTAIAASAATAAWTGHIKIFNDINQRAHVVDNDNAIDKYLNNNLDELFRLCNQFIQQQKLMATELDKLPTYRSTVAINNLVNTIKKTCADAQHIDTYLTHIKKSINNLSDANRNSFAKQIKEIELMQSDIQQQMQNYQKLRKELEQLLTYA